MFGLNPWFLLAVVLSITAAFGGGYWRGYSRADQKAEIKDLQGKVTIQKAAIDALSRDRDKTQRLADVYKRDADLALADMDTIQKLADGYAKDLASRPVLDMCVLDERDVRWLRDIASGRAALGLAPVRTSGAP
jgi:hypothetical protein